MQDRFEKIIEVVRRHMETPSTSWSIGSFGAIAEFHVDEDETIERNLSSSGGTVQSERGAICINLPEEVRAAPYEILRRGNHRWLHGVNFCVSQRAGAMEGRDILTELGGDKDALRVEDRGSILFDMGLGIPHVDVCVRTGDQDLIRLLRENAGTSMRAPDNPAIADNHAAHRRIGPAAALAAAAQHQRMRHVAPILVSHAAGLSPHPSFGASGRSSLTNLSKSSAA